MRLSQPPSWTAGDDVEDAYERHGKELVRFAALMVGPSNAEDVVADVMLSVLRGKRGRPIENWRAYLYQAVYRRAGSFERSRRRMRRSEELLAARPHVAPTSVDPTVRAAVDRLSRRQRAVVLLTYWQDLTPKDVSETLQIGEGSVRRHLARARRLLRKELPHD